MNVNEQLFASSLPGKENTFIIQQNTFIIPGEFCDTSRKILFKHGNVGEIKNSSDTELHSRICLYSPQISGKKEEN